MFEIFICVFIFYMGMLFGEVKLSWKLRDIIRAEARREGIKVDDEYNIISDTKPNIAKLVIEKSNDVLYLYDYEANTFVCQGKTIDELAALAQKYKNIKYAVVAHDDEMLMFVDGAVKEKE